MQKKLGDKFEISEYIREASIPWKQIHLNTNAGKELRQLISQASFSWLLQTASFNQSLRNTLS